MKPLWREQKQAISLVNERWDNGQGAALLMEMGTGKTRCAINAIERAFRKHNCSLAYIAAPLSVLHIWIEHWDLWAENPVCFIDLHESGSSGLDKALELSSKGIPVICLVNYEAAWQIGYKTKRVIDPEIGETITVRKKIGTELADINWDIGVLDESTAIKSPSSRVGKYFRNHMTKKTQRRLILTGSAYTKRPLDVWGQIKFITGNEIFSSFGAFKAFFTEPNPYIRGAIAGYKNLDYLTEKLKVCSIILKKEDILELPEIIHEKRMLKLSPKSRKVYKEITEDSIAVLENMEKVTAAHIFSVLQKQQHITSGFIYPDSETANKVPVYLGTEKLDELLYLVEELDKPVIVVVNWDEEEKLIAEMLHKRKSFVPKILNGKVKGAENRLQMVKEAVNDPVFVVKQSVGCKGLDMTAWDTMIFFSPTFNTINYEQMIARTHRSGQKNPCTYLHLLCEGTADVKIMKAVENDLNMAKEIENNWKSLLK